MEVHAGDWGPQVLKDCAGFMGRKGVWFELWRNNREMLLARPVLQKARVWRRALAIAPSLCHWGSLEPVV